MSGSQEVAKRREYLGPINLPTLDCRRSLTDKVVLITGGSKGIGKELVKSFLRNGSLVATTYNRSNEDLARRTGPAKDRISLHHLDLMDDRSIERVVADVVKRWGRLDILVHNAAAGSATIAHYEKDPAKQDAAMIRINVLGTIKICQEALPHLKGPERDYHRKIILLGSVGGGFQVFPKFKASDGASKAAVASFAMQLAAENTHSKIDVFCVCPGATDTPMFQESTLNHLTPENRSALEAQLPMGRLIHPSEVAQPIIFLASEHSTITKGMVMDASMGLAVRPGLVTEMKLH